MKQKIFHLEKLTENRARTTSLIAQTTKKIFKNFKNLLGTSTTKESYNVSRYKQWYVIYSNLGELNNKESNISR